MRLTQAMLASLLLATAPAAFAHGEAAPGKKSARKSAQPIEEKSFRSTSTETAVTPLMPATGADQGEKESIES